MATLYSTSHNIGRHRIAAMHPDDIARSETVATTIKVASNSNKQATTGNEKHVYPTTQSSSQAIKSTSTRQQQSPKFRFEARGSSACHPNKAGQCEDAYYISNCGRSIGVADGVGGWIEKGIDSGIYARELMDGAKTYVEDTSCTDPSVILQATYDQARATGTSTCCVVTVDGNRLRCANLGDSGFLLLRYQSPRQDSSDDHDSSIPSTEQKLSPEAQRKAIPHHVDEDEREWVCLGQAGNQQHWFNCPKQLGTDSNDMPCHADIYDIECQEGDIIIAATDGFLDNVSAQDLCDLVNHYSLYEFLDAARNDGQLSEALAEVALKLVMSASKVAQSDTRDTPFAISARQEGYNYTGGKVDDTTVVVGVIVPEGPAEPIRCYGQVASTNVPDTVTSVMEVEDIIMVSEHPQTPQKPGVLAQHTIRKTQVALDDYPASPLSTSSTCSHQISLSPQDFDVFDEDDSHLH